MYEFMLIAGLYILSFGLGIGLIWFFTGDFLSSFLKVKSSRGKFVLVKVRGNVTDYYRVGKIVDGMLKYKDSVKESKTLTWNSLGLYRSMNVNCVDVDEESNNIASRDYSFVSGHDAKKTDDLMQRCLYKPSMLNTEQKIILGLLIVAVAGIGLVGFLVFGISADVDQCVSGVGNVVGEV